MYNFEDLPIEIFNTIVFNVTINDIISLSLSNNYISSICNEKLYEAYIINKLCQEFHKYFEEKVNSGNTTWKKLSIMYTIDHKNIEIKHHRKKLSHIFTIFPHTTLGDINLFINTINKTEKKYFTLKYYNLYGGDGVYSLMFYLDKPNKNKKYHYQRKIRIYGFVIDDKHTIKNIPLNKFILDENKYNTLFTDIKCIQFNNKTFTLEFYDQNINS